MRFIISVGLVILLSSCAGTTNNYYTSTVKSWRGGSTQTLTQQWGTPNTKLVNPNGSTIYIYKTKAYLPNANPGNTPVSHRGKHAKSTSVGCLAIFEADTRGKIFNTEVRGKDCYGANFKTAKRNPGHL